MKHTLLLLLTQHSSSTQEANPYCCCCCSTCCCYMWRRAGGLLLPLLLLVLGRVCVRGFLVDSSLPGVAAQCGRSGVLLCCSMLALACRVC